MLGMNLCLLGVVFCDVAALVTWLLASCDEPGSIFVQMSSMQESEKCKKVKACSGRSKVDNGLAEA